VNGFKNHKPLMRYRSGGGNSSGSSTLYGRGGGKVCPYDFEAFIDPDLREEYMEKIKKENNNCGDDNEDEDSENNNDNNDNKNTPRIENSNLSIFAPKKDNSNAIVIRNTRHINTTPWSVLYCTIS